MILFDYERLRGGGGQENYGLFPQFVTFLFGRLPLVKVYRSAQ